MSGERVVALRVKSNEYSPEPLDGGLAVAKKKAAKKAAPKKAAKKKAAKKTAKKKAKK